MIYIVFVFVITTLYALFRAIHFQQEIKLHKQSIQHLEKDFLTVTTEIKDILALNKLCIEKWEKAVLENTHLAQTNLQLLTHLKEKENTN